MEELSLILSIIGALAWTPGIIKLIQIHRRKICSNIVDFDIITNAKTSSYDNKKHLNGTLVIIAANFFISDRSFFITNYDINVKLKSGTMSNAILFDGSVTVNRLSENERIFSLPKKYNLNLHKEIICEKDNIRILPLMLKNATINNIDEIEYVEMTFVNNRIKKTIRYDSKDFPDFNKGDFIANCFRNTNNNPKIMQEGEIIDNC